MTLRLIVDTKPDPTLRDAVSAPLRAFNRERYAPRVPHGDFAVYLRPDGSENVVGGLWAELSFDWLFINLLIVPEAERGSGLGSQLMTAAEEFAREKGLRGIWLDTFDFQARGFYERLGYEVCGQIDDQPIGHTLFILKKVLA